MAHTERRIRNLAKKCRRVVVTTLLFWYLLAATPQVESQWPSDKDLIKWRIEYLQRESSECLDGWADSGAGCPRVTVQI